MFRDATFCLESGVLRARCVLVVHWMMLVSKWAHSQGAHCCVERCARGWRVDRQLEGRRGGQYQCSGAHHCFLLILPQGFC